MNTAERRALYLRTRNELTPRQARRLRHKLNQETSDRVAHGVARYGRLKRRYNRKDRKRIVAQAARFVAVFGRPR